jgi:malate synthase
MERVQAGELQVAKILYDFVVQEALAGSGLSPAQFWSGYARLLQDLAPRNRTLLHKRDSLQSSIDSLPARYRLSAAGARAIHHRHCQCGCGNRPYRRAAAGGAGPTPATR